MTPSETNDLDNWLSDTSDRKSLLSRTNRQKRPREHLTETEVTQLRQAASMTGRYGHRDATLILVTYKHALRVSEVARLNWNQIDLKARLMTVERSKSGLTTTHPIRDDVRLALMRLPGRTGLVFANERHPGDALSQQVIHKIVARAGRIARLPFTVHPHMLRHACGYALADAGTDLRVIQHYLGHRSISSTVIYTQISPRAFDKVWLE